MIADFPLDFARLRKRWTPNQTLALPPGFTSTASADVVSPVFDAGVDEVHAAWIRVVTRQPRTKRLRREAGQIEIVQTTPLLGFPDWITAEPVDLGAGRASICVFSRSKYGVRDMGVNARRVAEWLAALRAEMKAA